MDPLTLETLNIVKKSIDKVPAGRPVQINAGVLAALCAAAEKTLAPPPGK